MTEIDEVKGESRRRPTEKDDLSELIEHAVERKSDEEVRCVRVCGDRYRCNWWVRDRDAHPMFSTIGRISRSKFLRVTNAGNRLVIDDLSSPIVVA